MRIAMIGCKGIPAADGGVEHVVEELSAELAARGHEVLVYARPGYLRRRASAPASAARIIETAGIPGKHTDTITYTATAAWDVLRRKVDVVHVHSPGPALLSFLPAAAGLPVLFTVHGPDWTGRRWSRPARWMLRAGLACGVRASTVVTAVSLSIAEFLADTYDKEVLRIPNGVRPAVSRPPVTIAGWGLRSQEYALYVGRIVPGKDLDLLVRTWRRIGIEMPLVIVGDTSQEPGYASACRREANEWVRFVGLRFGEVLGELYSSAAMVVQPSRAEGMSLVLLESAAHGRCVVARDIPGNRETLAEAMITFGDDSPEALGDAIIKCLSDRKLRQEVGRAAKRRVLREFAWPRIAREYERAYSCAVFKRQRAPHPRP